GAARELFTTGAGARAAAVHVAGEGRPGARGVSVGPRGARQARFRHAPAGRTDRRGRRDPRQRHLFEGTGNLDAGSLYRAVLSVDFGPSAGPFHPERELTVRAGAQCSSLAGAKRGARFAAPGEAGTIRRSEPNETLFTIRVRARSDESGPRLLSAPSHHPRDGRSRGDPPAPERRRGPSPRERCAG